MNNCGYKETLDPVVTSRGNKLTNAKTLLNYSKVYLLLGSKQSPGERKGIWKHETTVS